MCEITDFCLFDVWKYQKNTASGIVDLKPIFILLSYRSVNDLQKKIFLLLLIHYSYFAFLLQMQGVGARILIVILFNGILF